MESDPSHPRQTTGCAVLMNAAVVFVTLAVVLFALLVLWSRIG
jgi:hypothetical protein